MHRGLEQMKRQNTGQKSLSTCRASEVGLKIQNMRSRNEEPFKACK